MGYRTVFLITTWLLFSISSAFGEEAEQAPLYEVEIILFQHVSSAPDVSETWPLADMLPPGSNAMVLQAAGTVSADGMPYQLMRPQKLQLANEARHIEKSRDYRLLSHIGWLQPGLERELAHEILIYPYEKIDDLSTLPLILPGSRLTGDELSASEAILPAWYWQPHILGAVRLIRSRFLHLEIDLFLNIQKPLKEPGKIATHMQPARTGEPQEEDALLHEEPRAPTLFRLQESRRVRSSEIHYFDHPRFGMIASVRPYTPPVPASDAGKAGTSPAAAPRTPAAR